MAHVVIDSTALKVYGEGESETGKHSKEKCRTWRKLDLALDSRTYEVVSTEIFLVNAADNEVLPTLLNQLRTGTREMKLLKRSKLTN